MKSPVRPYGKLISIIFIIEIFVQGCTAVKGYQKMYLNDENMTLKSREVEIFEINAESYREGASGSTGGKAGGGCGCN